MRFLAFVITIQLFFAPLVLAASDSDDESSDESLMSYSELVQAIDAGNVANATIWDEGWWVTGNLSDGSYFTTRINPNTPIADRMVEAGIRTEFMHSEQEEEMSIYLSMFFNILPLLIFLAFFFFVMRAFGSKNNPHLNRAEKMQEDFLERMEKLLTRQKPSDG